MKKLVLAVTVAVLAAGIFGAGFAQRSSTIADSADQKTAQFTPSVFDIEGTRTIQIAYNSSSGTSTPIIIDRTMEIDVDTIVIDNGVIPNGGVDFATVTFIRHGSYFFVNVEPDPLQTVNLNTPLKMRSGDQVVLWNLDSDPGRILRIHLLGRIPSGDRMTIQ